LYTAVGTYSKKFNDAFSGTVNQAALAFADKPAAGIYGERRFMLAQLAGYNAALSCPLKTGGAGVSLHYFGAGSFTSTQAGLAYGKRLGENTGIGAQINYNDLRAAGYGSAATVSFEIGALWHIREKWSFGTHIYNPAGGRFGKQGAEKLASIYSIGAGYDASDVYHLSCILAKEEDQPLSLQLGMQYQLRDKLIARGGIAISGNNAFIGLGIHNRTWRVDAVTQWHPQLGFTPALFLLFDLKERKEEEPSL
ncbi:MAG: hypothetical protein JST39_21790, partial [Bacteroidetes bacterium]|nr:hypothetical protein [Bacteroidota bacterium]